MTEYQQTMNEKWLLHLADLLDREAQAEELPPPEEEVFQAEE